MRLLEDLPGCKVEPDSGESVTACVSRRARAAPESWDGVVAGDGHVARIGQVALIEVGAPSAVAGEAGGASAASNIRTKSFFFFKK